MVSLKSCTSLKAKKFNSMLDKCMANQASRCLDPLGPILKLHAEVDQDSKCGKPISVDRILELLTLPLN